MENGLNSSQLVFQEDNNLQFNCSGGASSQGTQRRVGVGVNVGLGVSVSDTGRKTREMSSFVGEKMFSIEGEQRFFGNQSSEFRRNMYESSAQVRQDRRDNPNWNHNGSSDGSDGDEDDDDDDVEDDDEVEEGDGEVDGLVNLGGGNKKDNSSGSVHSSSDKLREKGNLQKNHSSLGSSRGFLGKDGNGIHSGNNIRGGSTDHQQGRVNHYNNAVTVAAPDMYYSQFLQGPEGSSPGQKEIGENGCGFSGGKEGSLSLDCGEPLRAILSDPITGTLMDDAMILPCGHSFGSAGLQHVIRMKVCYTCSQSVTEDLVAPNLSLRYAIQAFQREEELHSSRASKRRRERFEQDKSSSGDLSMQLSRGKGVQFPFAVTDRVIIKGNKRTPQRFVGREAVVTTQCLNGWYVVKTLDNAESVKLQYRSLARVSDNPASNMLSSKAIPNWL